MSIPWNIIQLQKKNKVLIRGTIGMGLENFMLLCSVKEARHKSHILYDSLK